MNVYVWKDAADGKFHIYDLTTPDRPHEQTIDGPPTAAAMMTFFEDVARYPEGEVRYTLPDGTAGVVATTGKTKWYEWVGYAGLAIAAVGLAFLTAGASLPATVCFATGAVAGGVSAGGHLVDTARLGTATTATVVVDVAQIAASFASFGAMRIAVKAGSAATLAGSRWFVPLVGTAASADVVQLAVFTDVAFTEINKIQSGAGTPEDKQRAIAVLLTQFIVTGGLTVLSVQGARSIRALSGKPLEIVDQNGVKVLRMVGEETPAPTGTSATATGEPARPSSDTGERATGQDGQVHGAAADRGATTGSHANAGGLSAALHDPEHWFAELESRLDAEEKAKLAKMSAGKTPQQAHDMFGGDLDAAAERVRAAVRADQDRAAVAAQSKERVVDLQRQIADRGMMNDADVRAIVEGTTADNWNERSGCFGTSSLPSSCEPKPSRRILAPKCSTASGSMRSSPRRTWRSGEPRTPVSGLTASRSATMGSTCSAGRSIRW